MRSGVALLLVLSACLPQVGPPVGAGGNGGGGGGGGAGGGSGSATCANGQRDPSESDVDCGGPCSGCGVGAACLSPLDCATGVCGIGELCAAPSDPCPLPFAGCTSFVDASDAGVATTIRFPVGGSRYSPSCVRVRFGQAVVFTGGAFADHPLRQACGPVRNVVTANGGTSATLVMNRAIGVFGFYCSAHGSSGGSGMAGAIEVVP